MNVNLGSDTRGQPTAKVGIRNKFLAKLWSQRYLQVMALLGVAWMILFNYIPMYGITLAFKEYIGVGSPADAPWAGWTHFQAIWDDERMGEVVRNTLGISLLKLIIGFPLPILFALFLNELRSLKFNRVVQTISYLPHFLSWVILGGILTAWLSDVGILNDILRGLHFIDEPISYLAEPRYFWTIAIGSDIWKEFGWNAIIYIAAIASISPELYEAATIDGAGRFQKMFYVTLPSIRGTISILFILAVSALLNSNFDQILILKNQVNESMSNVVDTYVYEIGIRQGRFSYSTAVGLVKAFIALFLLLFANSVTKRMNQSSLF
ncbi:sugar ABC transporter permease [Cohnella endophytica]|uniref:Sugar ABC transporter permease n=1 Tax=Cohnella endophytica TaxID=2419778 RepID=A0A494X818_9BACL|nr:ABC transporter permease subunit [Cohnella endophytica]RKP46698.1 sugar ABC transporter permease [Cohnella endophytica]